jgi:molybdopterin/thiamine biosynthesis adenylyltransferase
MPDRGEIMQKSLNLMRIAVLGAGGTGCQLLTLLAEQGAELTIIDRDIVEESNLLRQPLYSQDDIGMPKAVIAAKKLTSLTKAESFFEDITYRNIQEILQRPRLVIDCTDNTETRLLLNDYCMKNSIPWIHTAASGVIGSVILITPNSPCYRCVFQEKRGESCTDSDVSIDILKSVAEQAVRITLEFLTKGKMEDGLLRVGLNRIMHISISKNENCPCCKGNYEFLEGRRTMLPERLCGTSRYLIVTGRQLDLVSLGNRLANVKLQTNDVIISDEYTIFKKGRVLVTAKSPSEARKKIVSIGL